MNKPSKIIYLNPVGDPSHYQVFADMTAANKLAGIEVHVTSLPPEQGAFTHIEFRAYEAMVTRGM